MAVKTYCEVNDATNEIENILLIEESEVDTISKTDYSYIEVSETDMNAEWAGIGHEHVNGYFQPKESNHGDWTKGEDGVWNELKTRPSANHSWNPIDSEWMDISDISAVMEKLVAISEAYPEA